MQRSLVDFISCNKFLLEIADYELLSKFMKLLHCLNEWYKLLLQWKIVIMKVDMGAISSCILLLHIIIHVSHEKSFLINFITENENFRCPILKSYNRLCQILADFQNRFFKSWKKVLNVQLSDSEHHI